MAISDISLDRTEPAGLSPREIHLAMADGAEFSQWVDGGFALAHWAEISRRDAFIAAEQLAAHQKDSSRIRPFPIRVRVIDPNVENLRKIISTEVDRILTTSEDRGTLAVELKQMMAMATQQIEELIRKQAIQRD